MAKSTGSKTNKKQGLIDPVYEKFTKSVIRALGSNDFYNFFMRSNVDLPVPLRPMSAVVVPQVKVVDTLSNSR